MPPGCILLKYSEPGKVLSIGRVQTRPSPCSYQRHLKSPISNLKISGNSNSIQGGYIQCYRPDASQKKSKALASVESIRNLPFLITDVTEKRERSPAPPVRPDLVASGMQQTVGWIADESLKPSKAFTKKVTTYPRVDNLPPEATTSTPKYL